MKITKDPVLGTWEMAESEQAHRIGLSSGLAPCDAQRILIVDDEESLRFSVRKVLEKDMPDCTFDVAANGAEAVERFAEGHPKIVLMDLSMPVMDGEQAFCRIMDMCEEKDWQPPGVVFFTGFDPPLGVRNVVASDPAHCLLQKPVRNQTLVMAVKKRIEKVS